MTDLLIKLTQLFSVNLINHCIKSFAIHHLHTLTQQQKTGNHNYPGIPNNSANKTMAKYSECSIIISKLNIDMQSSICRSLIIWIIQLDFFHLLILQHWAINTIEAQWYSWYKDAIIQSFSMCQIRSQV